MEHHFEYPTVREIDRRAPDVRTSHRPPAASRRKSQRELVAESLLRCPEGKGARARPGM